MGKETTGTGQKTDLSKTKVTGATATAPQPAQSVSAEVPVSTLGIDMKLAYEAVIGKTAAPADLIFKSAKGKEIKLASALSQALVEAVKGVELNKPVAVSRQRLLNLFCIQQKLTPEDSKRVNKSENKATTMYGKVPKFEDGFVPDGDAYRMLGGLKYPIVEADKIHAVKCGVYFIVFNDEDYKKFSVGQILEDAELTLVG